MAKTTGDKASPGQFDHIADESLRKKLEETAASHKQATAAIPEAVTGIPRFAFSRSTEGRAPGDLVKMRNGLDENLKGGTIVEKVGRAYRVQVDDLFLIVHEPDDTWE
jgi:hypothetical protein